MKSPILMINEKNHSISNQKEYNHLRPFEYVCHIYSRYVSMEDIKRYPHYPWNKNNLSLNRNLTMDIVKMNLPNMTGKWNWHYILKDKQLIQDTTINIGEGINKRLLRYLPRKDIYRLNIYMKYRRILLRNPNLNMKDIQYFFNLYPNTDWSHTKKKYIDIIIVTI